MCGEPCVRPQRIYRSEIVREPHGCWLCEPCERGGRTTTVLAAPIPSCTFTQLLWDAILKLRW